MRVDASDIQGLMPSIDARRSDKIFALNGKNFILDAKGPKSFFGNRYLTPFPLGAPEYSQGFRLNLRTGARVFTFTSDAVLEWREDLGTWRTIYVTGYTGNGPNRWTWGYLNGIVYFCHPVTGILAYEILSDSCLPLEVSGLPADPISIVINNGRLGIMTQTFYYWSGPGDGTDWVPRLGGAGFQLIADRISGDPIMLTAWAKGILIWTTGGVLQGAFAGDQSVYRWRAINTEFRPMNSFCGMQMDENTMVILDERGLFQSQGEAPTPMAPLFNEFLIQYLQDNDLELGENVRLEWDERRRLMYLSLSLSRYSPIYEKAFVLYPSLDKWGTFDEPHYGIMPWLIQESSRQGDWFGYVDQMGCARYWGGQRSREIIPVDQSLNALRVASQKPAHYYNNENSVVVVSSSGKLSTTLKAGMTGREGYYFDGKAKPVPATVTHLDSYIQFGLLRFVDQQRHDHLMELVSVFVGSEQADLAPGESEDYNTSMNPNEDWNLLSGHEDWGFGQLNFIDHGFRVIGTVDGTEEFDSTEPTLEVFNKSGRYYSCSVTGQWHIVEISAQQPGQSYHIKLCEFTAVDAGSLN